MFGSKALLAAALFSSTLGGTARAELGGAIAFRFGGPGGAIRHLPFRIPDGFTSEEQYLLDDALGAMKKVVNDYFTEWGAGNARTSAFATCVAARATKDFVGELNPSEYPTAVYKDPAYNAVMTMQAIWQRIEKHNDTAEPLVFNPYLTDANVEVARSRGPGTAGLGTLDPVLHPIEINRNAFSARRSAATWAGTLFHELLHSMGFMHPTGYPGSLIKEAGNCITSLASKGLGLAGSTARTIWSYDGGRFQQDLESGVWTEIQGGVAGAVFVDQGRDESFAYLYDESRDLWAALSGSECLLRWGSHGEWFKQYSGMWAE